jgi:hypothetical protein
MRRLGEIEWAIRCGVLQIRAKGGLDDTRAKSIRNLFKKLKRERLKGFPDERGAVDAPDLQGVYLIYAPRKHGKRKSARNWPVPIILPTKTFPITPRIDARQNRIAAS